jgi:capsular exopolysaccharide synthesis family protein
MILIRDYKNMQTNYQSLLEKRLNFRVAEKLEKNQQSEQFRILDPAYLPRNPEKQNRLRIMIVGLLGGCGLGVGLAFVLEQLNATFKRREEVERLPGVRVLATIPDFLSLYQTRASLTFSSKAILIDGNAGSESPSVRSPRSPSWIISGKQKALPPHLNLITKSQPRSIPAEQYRMAATRLAMLTDGHLSNIIGITSALKGEGKTTTVMNLGYVLARDFGKRTLLIDCDFRCPALHKYVDVKKSVGAGLIELLDGEAQLQDCIYSIDEYPCSVLPVGGTAHEYNELGKIQELKQLLPTVRIDYDYVILNTPPMLPSATMGVLAHIADIMILVIHANATPKPAVEQALKMLGQKAEILAILNRVEIASLPNYMYGYPPYGQEDAVEAEGKYQRLARLSRPASSTNR